MKKDLVRRALKGLSLPDVVQTLYPGKYVPKRGKVRCPFHPDKNPSFVIRTTNEVDSWECYAGCGKGDTFHFLITAGAARTITEGLNWLVENDLISSGVLSSDDEKNYIIAGIEKIHRKQELLERFSNFTKDCLMSESENSQRARDYFRERGIDNVETLISKFDVGFFDSSKLEIFKFTSAEIKELGLVGKDKKFKMDNCISFMYESGFGKYSGIKLRPFKENKPCFIRSENTKTKDYDIGFFGLIALEGDKNQSTNSDIILVEGEFDLLVPQYKTLHMYGQTLPILCRSGSAGVSTAAFTRLKELGITSLAVFSDNDEAGEGYIKQASMFATQHNMMVDVVDPPEYLTNKGTDPAELCKTKNANEILDTIRHYRKPISTYVASLAKIEYENIYNTFKDDSEIRIKSINKFVDLANEYSLTDLMRDEFSSILDTGIQDPLISTERIRKELNRKTSFGEVYRIQGSKYSVGNNGYEQWIPTDTLGAGYSQRITNFIIRYSTIVKFGNQEAYEINGDFVIEGKKAGKFTISSKDLVTPDQFNTLIRTRHPVGIEGLHKIKNIIPELVSLSNASTPMFKGIDRVGYAEGTRSYITPSTIIEEGDFVENREYNVAKSDATISTFFSAIDFNLKELEEANLEESKDLLLEEYLNCLPRKNTLMTLGHVMSSVLTPYFSRKLPPHALFFRGLAGSYKSTFAQVTMGLFYKDPFKIKWLHARDTPNSIEMAISYVDNAPMLLDDVKAERQNAEDVMMIIQSLYDEQGRSRLNRDLTVRRGRSVANQGLVVTGELIPTDQLSILSRMIQLEFKRDEAIVSKFISLQDKTDKLRLLTPFFIRWLQSNYQGVTLPLETFAIDGVENYERERSYHQICKMLTGLKMFFEFLHQEAGLEKRDKEKLLSEAKAYAKILLKDNLNRINSVSKETKLIEEIKGYLELNLFSVHGPILSAHEIGHVDKNGDPIIKMSRLKVGLKKVNSKFEGQLEQVIRDLSYQGECFPVMGGVYYKFPRETLFDSLEEDSGDIHVDEYGLSKS